MSACQEIPSQSWNRKLHYRHVFTGAGMKITAFWELALCSPVEIEPEVRTAFVKASTTLPGAISETAVIFTQLCNQREGKTTPETWV
jgi:hypothetical protein